MMLAGSGSEDDEEEDVLTWSQTSNFKKQLMKEKANTVKADTSTSSGSDASHQSDYHKNQTNVALLTGANASNSNNHTATLQL